MSPETAKALKVGDHVARRGPPDIRTWTHVGRVTRRTKYAISIRFATAAKNASIFKFAQRQDLALLRTADTSEVAGYKKVTE